MDVGDEVTVHGEKFVVEVITSPLMKSQYYDLETTLVVLLHKIEKKPDIRWERIPDDACKVSVTNRYVYFTDKHGCHVGNFIDHVWNDWFFPNHSDFIGQTFERPKDQEHITDHPTLNGCDA